MALKAPRECNKFADISLSSLCYFKQSPVKSNHIRKSWILSSTVSMQKKSKWSKRRKKKAEEGKLELEFLLHEQIFWIYPQVLLFN